MLFEHIEEYDPVTDEPGTPKEFNSSYKKFSHTRVSAMERKQVKFYGNRLEIVQW